MNIISLRRTNECAAPVCSVRFCICLSLFSIYASVQHCCCLLIFVAYFRSRNLLATIPNGFFLFCSFPCQLLFPLPLSLVHIVIYYLMISCFVRKKHIYLRFMLNAHYLFDIRFIYICFFFLVGARSPITLLEWNWKQKKKNTNISLLIIECDIPFCRSMWNKFDAHMAFEHTYATTHVGAKHRCYTDVIISSSNSIWFHRFSSVARKISIQITYNDSKKAPTILARCVALALWCCYRALLYARVHRVTQNAHLII